MKQLSLLIADDEDTIRNGITRYIRLHSERFSPVYQATDGQEAHDIIFLHRPDIALLDIQMPCKTGLEVMQEAADAGILPVTVVLSGFDEFEYCQQALRCGARDYLLKPVRSGDIIKKLNELADAIAPAEDADGQEEDRESSTNLLVRKAKRYMEQNYYKDLNLDLVAEHAGITPGYLSTLFTQNTGAGFVETLNRIRVEHACAYIIQGGMKSYEIAYKVGFKDEKYFSKVFHKITGESPNQYKKSHSSF